MSDEPVLNPFAPGAGAPDPEPFTTETERLLAGLSYVSQVLVPGVLPAILLLGEDGRRSGFLRYHAVHSLALLVATVLYYIAATMVFIVVGSAATVLLCVLWILFLPPVAVLAYYGYQAFRGRREVIPWLTDLLRRYGWLY